MALAGCQKLTPESVNIPEYPDFEELMKDQVDLLGNTKITKEVRLERQNEVKVMEMDSTAWASELSFLKEINPNQPEYVGVFETSEESNYQILRLKSEESGALKQVKYAKSGAIYEKILATFHEDKDVYVHHRNIEMNFDEGILHSLKIDGYQKMMFRDTVRFSISIRLD